MTNDNLTRRDFVACPVVAGLDAARASRLARFAATDRKDIRALQAIYRFAGQDVPFYVGQEMDVFIDAPTSTAKPENTRCITRWDCHHSDCSGTTRRSPHLVDLL